MNLSIERRRLLVCCLLLFISTFILFLPVVQNEFINFDDDKYITNSELVQQGFTFSSAVNALVEPHFFMWHPVTTWSLQLDRSIFGSKPSGYHLVNVFWHSLSSILCFLLVWRLRHNYFIALLVAALFAWHPLRVESVAWAAERKDVLSTFFWLLALNAYVRWQTSQSIRYQRLTYVATILAMMSKPIAVTLPVTFLLLDFWPLNRLNADTWQDFKKDLSRLIPEKALFLFGSLFLSVITISYQSKSKTLVGLEEMSVFDRLANSSTAYFSYIGKIFLPVELAAFYPPDPDPNYLAPFAFLALAGIFLYIAWKLRRERPYFLFGFIWFLSTLLPVIGLLQSGRQSMADRYTYVSSIGILMMFCFWLWDAWLHKVLQTQRILISLLLLIPCTLLTYTQLAYWRNSETLFTHALSVTENNYIAHINLGAALAEKGDLASALPHYEAALNIRPSTSLLLRLSKALLSQRKPELAQMYLEQAIKLEPDFAEAYFELAMALADQDKLDEGTKYLEKAIKLKPELKQRLSLPPETPPAKKAAGTP